MEKGSRNVSRGPDGEPAARMVGQLGKALEALKSDLLAPIFSALLFHPV
ncbi:hypothetical protein SS05631_c33010 [Sinorhizobium sp. CCBAU 05631]|nr:hypothetical protein SS05631_c33010 [Sinorhizobium sp. CCBAU 05631]